MNQQIKVSFVTLGCRLNQADTALLSGRFSRMGIEVVSLSAERSPEIIVVNSCAVTGMAVKKSYHALSSLRKNYPKSFLILTGCAAEAGLPETSDSKLYDIILNNEQKKNIEKIILEKFSSLKDEKKNLSIPENMHANTNLIFFENVQEEFPFKTRAILKVQEGCNNFCSYCIVPYTRGRERSRDNKEVLNSFHRLVQSGIREIVLSGVNICNYHCNGMNLCDLMEEMMNFPGDFRIRLSSTEPCDIVPEIISFISRHKERVCSFLHLPLQNGSDTILKKMGRKYLTNEYNSYIQEARSLVPDIHIGSDIITGFPGETKEMFQESCDFIEKISFSNIHIFPFSPRKGTPAENMCGRIVGDELEERVRILSELKEKMTKCFLMSQKNKTEKILFEKNNGGFWEGWTGNYIRAKVKSSEDLSGQLRQVVLRKLLPDGGMEADLIV